MLGPIWIAGGDVGAAFPERGWSDFVVVLLGAWIPSLRILAIKGQTAECRFMDGPYHFSVGVSSPEEWRISCFEDRRGPSVANAVAEWNTSRRQFLESALSAARQVLGYCDTRQWWNDDTDCLRAALASSDPGAAS
jgi:hypothetical protein